MTVLKLMVLYEFFRLHKGKKQNWIIAIVINHILKSSPLFSQDLDLFKRHNGTINTLIPLDVF